MKRVFDIVLSGAGLVLLAPVILVLVLLIRLGSSGPGIFRQTRIGRKGKPFICKKLRTMRQGTPERPTHESEAAAVTAMGAFLRRTKLDELPQLWNVLVGEMSLVGPRPCLPSQTDLTAARQRLGVDELRPGITGVSQVLGIDMSDPERLASSDALYLSIRSIRTDLRLILQTLLGAGAGDLVKVHEPHG